MFRSSSPTAIPPSYYDIRIHSPYKNIIMINGSYQETGSVSISGHVVLSLSETTSLSSISLRMEGVYKLGFIESFQTKDGNVLATSHVRNKECVIDCFWENLLTNDAGVIVGGSYEIQHSSSSNNNNDDCKQINIQSPSNLLKFTNTKTVHRLKFHDLIPTGQTPFPNSNSIKSNNSLVFDLPPGNYSLPFKIKLPGNIPETVEGLKCGMLYYKFESRLNGTLNNSSINENTISKTYKYFRIFRTLSAMGLAINEEVLTENCWPKKLQYKIRIPKKKIPVGSNLKIYFLILPLLKGLKLGKISIEISQYLTLKSKVKNQFNEDVFKDERIVFNQDLPTIPGDQLSVDNWALEANIPLPNNLKRLSPDVSNYNDSVKIRHRLTIFINLINPDGHVSQIKSKLPISFYIKPDGNQLFTKHIEIDHEVGDISYSKNLKTLFENKIEDTPEIQPPEILVGYLDETDPDSFLFGDLSYELDSRGDGDYTIDEFNDFTRNKMCYQLPSYKDSNKDLLFEPSSWGINSGFATPTSINCSGGSNISLADLIKEGNSVAGKVPSYREVYDDDVIAHDDPSPLYDQDISNNFFKKSASVPGSRVATPVLRDNGDDLGFNSVGGNHISRSQSSGALSTKFGEPLVDSVRRMRLGQHRYLTHRRYEEIRNSNDSNLYGYRSK